MRRDLATTCATSSNWSAASLRLATKPVIPVLLSVLLALGCAAQTVETQSGPNADSSPGEGLYMREVNEITSDPALRAEYRKLPDITCDRLRGGMSWDDSEAIYVSNFANVLSRDEAIKRGFRLHYAAVRWKCSERIPPDLFGQD